MSNITDLEIIAKEVKKKFSDNIATTILAIMGFPAAQIQIGVLLAKGAISIPDWLFYNKLDKFLRGLELSDRDRADMRAFLASKGCATDNCIRIMNCINMVESEKKIEFICNATRCALANEMDLQLYFRIVNAINVLMEDDIEFLAENIHSIKVPAENHFESNRHTQALFTVGAMKIITTVWENGDYAFTPFAKLIDVSTINFPNDARYPNRKEVIVSCLED